jgi:hypothetical protein
VKPQFIDLPELLPDIPLSRLFSFVQDYRATAERMKVKALQDCFVDGLNLIYYKVNVLDQKWNALECGLTFRQRASVIELSRWFNTLAWETQIEEFLAMMQIHERIQILLLECIKRRA